MQFKSIRILVGIEVDSYIATLNANLCANPHKKAEFIDKFTKVFCKEQVRDINDSPYSHTTEESVQLFIDTLTSKTLQIKIIHTQNVHAKFYIFATEPTKSHTGDTRYSGSLIVGSSNLSENGLRKNYEFNLESNASDDIAYALYEFESLWQNAIELDEISALEKQIAQDTYLALRSPKEIYYKLLIEHYGLGVIKSDLSIERLFPAHFYKPEYQKDAIMLGIEKLKKYNGFFLSDVVGLGKTLIACAIAKKCEMENSDFNAIVITPKALISNWERHFELVNLSHRKVISYDLLYKEQDKAKDYSLVIVDESHNFALNSSNRYKNLQQFCKNPSKNGLRKKVILLSATPQKNSPRDIKHQILLFQDENHSNIDGIPNLKDFFSDEIKAFDDIKKKLESAYKSYDKEKIAQEKERLKKISHKIKSQLLSKIMIRRTRADLSEKDSAWNDDLKAQNIIFPQVQNPKDLHYNLKGEMLSLSIETLKLLEMESNAIGKYGYYRYLIYPNLTAQGKEKYEQNYEGKKIDFTMAATSLQGLIKMLFFKRFESSIKAFQSTIAMQIKAIESFLKMYSTGFIKVPKKNGNLEAFYDKVLENDDEKTLDDFLGKGDESHFIQLQSSDFVQDYANNLAKDLSTLKALQSKWDAQTNDPKLHCLKDNLDNAFSDKKLVIFTEAKTTAQYLYSALKNSYNILQIDASNRETNAEKIRENFDANYENQKDDFHILITTDTLAEGVNLHRANIIINYDSPWSATNLMQRIGRINRIGTPHKQIEIYNFKPTDLGDLILNYNSKAFQKLQSFHFTLGEDNAVYDESEEVGSQKLYEIIRQGFEEKSQEWYFLNDIKSLYTHNPKEFERINNLPLKSRTFIVGDNNETFVYFKQKQNNATLESNALDFYYRIDFNSALVPTPQSIDFLTLAQFLRTHKDDKPIKIDLAKRQNHYESIKQCLDFHANKLTQISTNLPNNTDKKTKDALVKITHCESLSTTQKDNIKQCLKEGRFSDLPSQISKAKHKDDFEAIAMRCANLNSIDDLETTNLNGADFYDEPEIQLSISTFCKTHSLATKQSKAKSFLQNPLPQNTKNTKDSK